MFSDERYSRIDHYQSLDLTGLLALERDGVRDVDLLVSIGQCYFKQLELTKCHQYYLYALEIDSEDGWTHLYLGNLYYGVSCYEESENHYKRAVELLPDVACPHWCLGDLYGKMGYWTRTEQSYYRALEIDPTDAVSKRKLDEWLVKKSENFRSK